MMDVKSFVMGAKSPMGGTRDYAALSNKPQINGVTLSGNTTTEDLGLADAETVSAALDNKVDKVSGKGLSTEDYTTAEKAAVATIGDKVDKEAGKGLSTEDYTTADKTKLAGIPADATNNAGTITGITMNGASKGTSGVVDLGTVLTEHQDISGKADASTVNTLIGSDANMSVRAIANAELAAQLIPEDAQASLDTLQEIAAWIQAHPADAAAINAKLILGTHEVSGQQVEYATVKAYVEAMVSGLIKLTALSAAVSGNGNAVTSLAYNSATGAFTATKGATFLTEHQDISGKVDKEAGKGLSANNYTTAEKQKLENIEAEAQVNEVSAEQYASALGNIAYLSKENQSLRRTLDNLISGLSVSLTMTMSGTKGYLFIEDAAAGSVSSLSVNSSLSGTTLYIQIRNVSANTFQSTTATVSADGNVSISGLTVASGVNQVYVAKTAYVWTGNMSMTIGADRYPVNGVDFTIAYPRDKELGVEVDKGFLIWDEFLEICGYKVTRTAYASTAAAIAGFNNGETVVIKTEPNINYSKSNEYGKICEAPSADSRVTYYRETYSLVA